MSRFSSQVRADHPEPLDRPDPRAIQLALAVIEIDARGEGVSIRDLMEAGFSATTELFEHHLAANSILQQGPASERASATLKGGTESDRP